MGSIDHVKRPISDRELPVPVWQQPWAPFPEHHRTRVDEIPGDNVFKIVPVFHAAGIASQDRRTG